MSGQTQQVQAGERVGLPGRLRGMLAELAAARPEGLSEADLLEVITLGEALKGSLAGVQARATACCVEGRDARVAEMGAARVEDQCAPASPGIVDVTWRPCCHLVARRRGTR